MSKRLEDKDLEGLSLEELSVLSEQGFRCDHEKCDHYEEFNQSHIPEDTNINKEEMKNMWENAKKQYKSSKEDVKLNEVKGVKDES